MNALRLLLSLLALVAVCQPLTACDLEVTIRPHTDRIVFGDPLYVEVEIVNRGEQPVSGPPPSLWLNTFWFTVSYARERLTYTHRVGGAGGGEPIVFEPDQPVKYYCYFSLPHVCRFDNPFWRLFRGGGGVAVSGVYAFRPSVLLASTPHYLSITPRPQSEIASLANWRKREVKREEYKKGPTPADFHLPVHIGNREELAQFALDTALSGELGDLVDLSLRFRDLYESPPESREAANRVLVEWLRKEPNTKRQVLARELRSLAEGYNMRSTAEALQTLIEESDAHGRETRSTLRGSESEAEGSLGSFRQTSTRIYRVPSR